MSASRLKIPNNSLLNESQKEVIRTLLDFNSPFDEDTVEIKILIAQLLREFSESHEKQEKQITKLKMINNSLELLCTVDDLKEREERVEKKENELIEKKEILDFREKTLKNLQNSIDFDSNFMYQQRQLIEELRKKLGYRSAVAVTPSSAATVDYRYYSRRDDFNDDYDPNELPF